MTWFLVLMTLLFASPSWATTYYFATADVSPAGSDSNACSFAAPCLTVAKMISKQSGLGAGDSILLREACAWNTAAEFGGATKLNVTVDGTGDADGSRFIVGAYLAATGARVTKADIDGGTVRPIISGDDPDVAGSFNRPGSADDGMIAVYGDYVTIENIDQRYSTGHGIIFASTEYPKAYNNVVSWSQRMGIFLQYTRSDWSFGADIGHGVVEYNTIHHTGACDSPTYNIWPNPPNPRYDGSGIYVRKHPHFTLRYNTIYDHYVSQSIMLNYGSDNGVVEKNLIYEVSSTGIYITRCSNLEIRYNLIHGTADTEFKNTDWGGGVLGPNNGIAMDPEQPEVGSAGRANNDIHIYGNLIAYRKYGFNICNTDSLPTPNAMTGILIYNNTVIDCMTNLRIIAGGTGCTIAAAVKNNIFAKFQSTYPTQASIGAGVTLTKGFNMWSSNPGSPMYDATDTIAVPQLVRSTTWIDLPEHVAETGANFEPIPGSNVVDRVDGTSGYTTLPLSGSTWPTSVTAVNAALYGKPSAPTATPPSRAGALLNPTCTSSAFAQGAASSQVDFGAIQLNAPTHTESRWEVDNTPYDWASCVLDVSSATALLSYNSWAVNLATNTIYKGRVQHKSEAGWGAWSTPVEFTTGVTGGGGPPPGTPTHLGTFVGSR